MVQKNKVRGCNSATSNMINPMTKISEKLQLPSTDLDVSVIRELRTAGWVLDERKAYRQIAILPDHRKFSVNCLKDLPDSKAKIFVMIGQSYGLVPSVYDYNRRSSAINEILEEIFSLVAFNFYDDKYGFEPKDTIDSAFEVAQKVHTLGARFDQKKLQITTKPVILGVTYNLEDYILEIEEEKKAELKDQIDSILKAGELDPGTAVKLKGKLTFGASQLWGKVGRAFSRALSERQYLKDFGSDRSWMNEALTRAVTQWRKLIESGPPRQITLRAEKKSDAVIFTDGFTPDARFREKGADRVGAVIFNLGDDAPSQFTAAIPNEIRDRWLVREAPDHPDRDDRPNFGGPHPSGPAQEQRSASNVRF